MCGIYAAVSVRGRGLGMPRAEIERARDTMAHRGPDGAGVWEAAAGHVALAHRRLAVLDPTDAGAQPMAWPHSGPARWVISYNGELYNDAEIRRALEREGVVFRTGCDTETVIAALDAWGDAAIAQFRGMFALAAYDASGDRIVVARDPLGIKPVYWAETTEGRVFIASEPGAILASPGVRVSPNWRMVSAYISTIRTTLDGDTLFEGVRSVQPGTIVEFGLGGARVEVRDREYWRGPKEQSEGATDAEVRAAVEASVVAHLRSDVPTCCLVSGGLDSTIIAMTSAPEFAPGMGRGRMRTYGAGPAVEDDEDPANSDVVFGARVARGLGSDHGVEVLTRDGFVRTWARMVGAMGVPLSTPNEVAINGIATRLRADGCVVTMSGEGADEIFGGYDAPVARVVSLRAQAARDGAKVTAETAGLMELVGASWAPPGIKDRVVRPEVWRALDQDAWVHGVYARLMRRSIEDAGGDGIGAHLRMHRRVNLVGLLQRLDSATMLASVEGRTPFADAEIAALGESMPVGRKIAFDGAGGDARTVGGAAVAVGARTKIALREAFGGVVPGYVLDRPKRSFPVPFRKWIGDVVRACAGSALVREVYPDAVVEEATANPEGCWHVAWPMANLALWGERWWGRGAA